jgi:hypothetical protein
MVKPKAEFVDCKCNWGLFRDRNVTLRKPVMMYHGISNLSMKGWVKEFDGKDTMGWWKKDSTCDKIGGQDAGTLPPATYTKDPNQKMDIFISLMCRRIQLFYEQDVLHDSIPTLRFVPRPNAMGSHNDSNAEYQNKENACYCMEEEGFTCFKSGVLNMAPCKTTKDRPKGAPIALSYPHFYQADPSFREAVVGMTPKKELHEFYIDVLPEFGFPLAIRPRFQLNAVLRRDPDIPLIANFADQLVLPFLWAQDGYSEPSLVMASKIKMGLAVPGKLSKLGGIILVALGGVLLLSALAWSLWNRKTHSRGSEDIVMS